MIEPGFHPSLVSIITPAWKVASVVRETIDSVRAQTYTHWEMLVVDDCSPDATAAVVERAAQADGRIRLIRQPVNGGPAMARNAALLVAKGRWVAFLDSDDLWLPQKLEHQIRFHEAAAAKISFTQFRRMTNDVTQPGRLIGVPPRLDYRALLGNTAIATSTVLVDRNMTGRFAMRRMYYDDFGCWLELLRPGGFAVGLQEDLMRYRVMGGSVSRNKRNSAFQVWRTYREIEGLSVIPAAWYFVNYAVRGYLKYFRF